MCFQLWKLHLTKVKKIVKLISIFCNASLLNIRKIIAISVIAIMVLGIFYASNFAEAVPKVVPPEKARVIAHTDQEVSDAVAKGCKVVRDAITLKALVCSPIVASSLGLQEDIRVFAVDSGANTQIGAGSVHADPNTGAGTKIVVLDTGYNRFHPELSSSDLGGYDFVNNDNDPLDDSGHGSHVAGIITADGINSNAKGVAPGAGIISGKVLDYKGSGFFSDIVAAIYWAVDGPDGDFDATDDNFNADAISMSLGTGKPYVYKGFCDNVLPDLTTAISYAVDHGVIVIVAAGNEGGAGVSIPGCISYSTTVGAVDSVDEIARFSGRGNSVDLSAPGVRIFSSSLGTNYATGSGTSMATPMVSGVVALIKAASPDATVTETQNALFQTADDFGKAGWDNRYGFGRVDARDAVDSVTSPISNILATPSSTSATITWTTDEAATSRVDYGLDISYGLFVSDPTLVTSHSIELIGLSSSTTYHFKVTSVDSSGNIASSEDLTFNTTAPPPPDEDEPNPCPPGHARRGLCTP